MRPCAMLLLCLAVSACFDGEITSPGDAGVAELCEEAAPGSVAPAAPSVLTPMARALDVTAASFEVTTSPFSDGDAGEHVATAFELWLMAGDEPVLPVWSAIVDEPAALTSATLDDGAFLPGFDELLPWQRYSVRARHLDDDCAWSEWSERQPFRIDDGSTFWFSTTDVHTISIELSDESWAAIDAEAEPPGCVPYRRSYYEGAVTAGGVRYEGVGVRAKGGCGSARGLDEKAGLKLHLGWDDPAVPGCGEERRARGLERFTLNNQVQDRSRVHEVLAYHLYRSLGIPVPRVAQVRVEVNGEYFGLYLNVETHKRRMLSRWFDSDDGMLYEGVYSCDPIGANVPDSEDAESCFQKKFETDACSNPDPGADPTTWEALRVIAEGLDAIPEGEFGARLGDYLDRDNFFSLWAIDAVMGHWDGFMGVRNNYRIYHDPISDRGFILPHGVDQTFDVDINPFTPVSPIGQRCLAEPACAEMFATRLAEVNDHFEAQVPTLVAMARAQQELNRPHLTSSREPGVEGIDASVDATVSFIEGRAQQIRERLAQYGY